MTLPVSPADRLTYCPLREQAENIVGQLANPIDEREHASLTAQLASLQALIEKSAPPVYYLATPTLMERAAFRRDVRAAGATYPGDDKLYAALRRDLEAVAPYNLSDLIDLVDETEAAAKGEVDPRAFEALETVTRIARALGGEFSGLEGDREFWLAVAPITACRHFLLGWDNGPVPFVRTGGRVSPACLEALGEMEARAIGFRIMMAMQPTKDQEKNSASLSPSPSPPTNSPSAAIAPPTAAHGSSLGSDISAIPDSA